VRSGLRGVASCERSGSLVNVVPWCSVVLLRLAYLGVSNAFALLRLPPMSDRDKDAEILALRHELVVLQRQLGANRVRFTPTDRALLAALLHHLPRRVLGRLHLVVRPDTLLRWHRDHPTRIRTCSLTWTDGIIGKRSVEVELFADGGNNAVVRLPGRTFPGVLIQGDSLSSLRAEVASRRGMAHDRPSDCPRRADSGGRSRRPQVDHATATC